MDKNFDEADDEDNDIMSHLNYRKLQKIKEDFMKQEDGLSMEQFIKVMLIHLPGTRDRIGLVKNLIELFRQIDVNNDQSLEWDEFTGHIIELGKFQIFIFNKFPLLNRYGLQRQDVH